MRDDLKERLKNIENIETLTSLVRHWSHSNAIIANEQGQSHPISPWIFEPYPMRWPDSRVEAFLDWAEMTENAQDT